MAFEKAVTTSPLKFFKMCGSTSPTPWSKQKYPRTLRQREEIYIEGYKMKNIDKFQNFTFFPALRNNFLDFGLDHNVKDTPLHVLKIIVGRL